MLRVIHDMSWAVRLFYLCVIVACLANATMACRKKFKSHWRLEFAYTSVVTGVFMTYVVLRISGVLDPADYAHAVRWLYPCLTIPFIACPLLFYWEDKYYQKALHRAVESELADSDSS